MGGFYNQVAGATQELGQETSRLGTDIGNMWKSIGGDVSSSIETAGNAYLKYQDHKEISAGAPAGADLLSALDQKWNETAKTADPNDPATRQKFLKETVRPAIDQFKGGFTTENSQAWAQHFTDQIYSHLTTKTAADQATLAGIAAHRNVTSTINTLSSTVRNDPSSLDIALKSVDSAVTHMVGSSPTMDAATAARVQSELTTQGKAAVVKSFMLGIAEKNPAQAQKILDSGKYAEFIDGTEAKTIINYAKTNQRLAQSEARNARVMQDYTAKNEFHEAANKLELSTAPANPGESPTLPKDYWENVRKIGQMPGAQLEPGRLKSMVENGERITARLGKPEPLAPVSHETTMSLIKDMRAGKIDSNDAIYKAYGENKLTTADFNFLQKEYAQAKTPDGELLNKDRDLFFKQYAGAIDNAYSPQLGSTKVYNAEMYARRVEAQLRSKGLDPHLAYDPTSEYFVGKPALIQKYQGDMTSDLKEVAARKSVNLTADDSKVISITTEEKPIERDAPRTAGNSYMTPLGKMKWTGTGWVKP